MVDAAQVVMEQWLGRIGINNYTMNSSAHDIISSMSQSMSVAKKRGVYEKHITKGVSM